MPKTSKSRRKRQSRRTQAVIASTPRVVGAFPTGTGAAQQLFKPLRVALAFYHSVDIETPYEDIRFSMNSLYDPLYDTGGGACSYFTSFAQIYPRYYVRSARIEVSAKTTGVDTVIAIVPSNSAHPNVILTLDHALELPGTQWSRCTDNGNPTIVFAHYTVDQVEGYDTSNDRGFYAGTGGSSPSRQPVMHVLVRPQNSRLNNNCKLLVKSFTMRCYSAPPL